MEDNLTGMQIGGYTLGRQVAEGGMGSVYQATHPDLDEVVAIKVLLPAYADDSEYRQRFKREAQLMQSLQHPHIGPIYT